MFTYLNYGNEPHFVVYHDPKSSKDKPQWPSTSVWMVPGTWRED